MRGAQWIENLTGMHFHEYDTLTYVSTTPNNGGVLICQTLPKVITRLRFALRATPGGEGDMKISSYSSWVATSDGTAFYGIELPGRLVQPEDRARQVRNASNTSSITSDYAWDMVNTAILSLSGTTDADR